MKGKNECWLIRPCDDEMRGRCAHAVVRERCPSKCHFAACWSKRHELASDPFEALLVIETSDEFPVKEDCLSCTFFADSNKK